MRSYRDISIRYKLQGTVIVTCTVVLFVASAAFTVYEVFGDLRQGSDASGVLSSASPARRQRVRLTSSLHPLLQSTPHSIWGNAIRRDD